MRNRSSVENTPVPGSVTVSFGERFQASEQFDLVFKEGMALVERTAAYLEGPGRAESKRLAAPANVLYAAESMRLTTRLLDLASWLLIRRAIKEGELSEAEAQAKRKNVTLQSPARAAHVQGFSSLPRGLQLLIEESDALNERIVRLDRAMSLRLDALDACGDAEPALSNPVGMQLNRLRVAFSN